jgi:hypothetical protein
MVMIFLYYNTWRKIIYFERQREKKNVFFDFLLLKKRYGTTSMYNNSNPRTPHYDNQVVGLVNAHRFASYRLLSLGL